MSNTTCHLCPRELYVRDHGGLCRTHYRRMQKHGTTGEWRPDAHERFDRRVDRDGPVPQHQPDLGPCWVWTGARNGNGYGAFRSETGKQVRAHRWAYEREHGRLDDALQVDHLCRRRECVRPSHLEAVQPVVNIQRRNDLRERCANGTHPRPPAGPDGVRRCPACRQDAVARYADQARKPIPERCRRDHPMSEETVKWVGPDPICRECVRINARAAAARRRAA